MKTTALSGHFQKDCCFVDARNYFGILYKMGWRLSLWKEEGALKNGSVGGFYLGSVGLLRYTQITTRHVTHSAVNIDGKTAKSQGHTVW